MCMRVRICMTERVNGDMEEEERQSEKKGHGGVSCLQYVHTASILYERMVGTYSNEALHIHGVQHTRANLIHLHTLTLVRPESLSSPSFVL